VLTYHRRRGVITFKIIDVAPAYVGLSERAVIFVSPPALAMANKEEFAALVAHEIGHEYVWTDYQLALRRREYDRIRQLELQSDGIGVLTLRRLGVNPERLVRAVEMMTWYNEQRNLAADRKEYVSRDDRRASRDRFSYTLTKSAP
jgi:predicted Zn-dependent protease